MRRLRRAHPLWWWLAASAAVAASLVGYGMANGNPTDTCTGGGAGRPQRLADVCESVWTTTPTTGDR